MKLKEITFVSVRSVVLHYWQNVLDGTCGAFGSKDTWNDFVNVSEIGAAILPSLSNPPSTQYGLSLSETLDSSKSPICCLLWHLEKYCPICQSRELI